MTAQQFDHIDKHVRCHSFDHPAFPGVTFDIWLEKDLDTKGWAVSMTVHMTGDLNAAPLELTAQPSTEDRNSRMGMKTVPTTYQAAAGTALRLKDNVRSFAWKINAYIADNTPAPAEAQPAAAEDPAPVADAPAPTAEPVSPVMFSAPPVNHATEPTLVELNAVVHRALYGLQPHDRIIVWGGTLPNGNPYQIALVKTAGGKALLSAVEPGKSGTITFVILDNDRPGSGIKLFSANLTRALYREAVAMKPLPTPSIERRQHGKTSLPAPTATTADELDDRVWEAVVDLCDRFGVGPMDVRAIIAEKLQDRTPIGIEDLP